MTTLSSNIFNIEKSDYRTPSLFMGQKPGLFDSINKPHPEITKIYKRLKANDWDELETDFGSCNNEFKSCDPSTRFMMIASLAWQWEQDSIAAHSLAAIGANFCTSDELWAAWVQVNQNECVHALTYSEIVRASFDNPDEVMKEILSVKESITRLGTVAKIYNDAFELSHKLALGLVERDQAAYNTMFMFVVANYFMERVQFMASFNVTALIVYSGWFQPIGTMVQKIAKDENEFHAPLGKLIIETELRNPYGDQAFIDCKDTIKQLLIEVIETEFSFIDFLFSEGRELVGADAHSLKNAVLWWAKEPADLLYIKLPYDLPKKNPLSVMDKFLDLDSVEDASMEVRSANYLLGGVVNDSSNKVYEIDL
jgi:ribonucleoside-diphosphate reductase beta chain